MVAIETTWNRLRRLPQCKSANETLLKGEKRQKCKTFLNTHLCYGLFFLPFIGLWRPASSRRRPRTGASCTTALKRHGENSCAFGLGEMEHSNCVVPFYEKTEPMSGKWFIFSRGYIEMFSDISFSDNENGRNKCVLVYFI